MQLYGYGTPEVCKCTNIASIPFSYNFCSFFSEDLQMDYEDVSPKSSILGGNK